MEFPLGHALQHAACTLLHPMFVVSFVQPGKKQGNYVKGANWETLVLSNNIL
jgi:hypothetical protein